jgi:hypothetical protein
MRLERKEKNSMRFDILLKSAEFYKTHQKMDVSDEYDFVFDVLRCFGCFSTKKYFLDMSRVGCVGLRWVVNTILSGMKKVKKTVFSKYLWKSYLLIV